MTIFGLTVVARDSLGKHYVNHTVRASTLDRADQIVVDYYAASEDELVFFDQALELDGDIDKEKSEGIIETMGKAYFQDE